MVHDPRSTWRPARVLHNIPVANGSMWIELEALDSDPASFEPGHVLGLGLKQCDGTTLRHAYTVSRGRPEARRFGHLYRIITGGRLSPRLATLETGDEVHFHGPFHTPIQQEVRSDAEHIILMSTGAGVGPLFGYAEKALTEGESRPLTLYAGFREESNTCLVDELSALAHAHKNFTWQFTLTHPSRNWRGLAGRVTDCVPPRLNRQRLDSYHFHLVGNGAMVHLVRRSLLQAGVSVSRVSTETYFNHHKAPLESEIRELAARFQN